MQYWWRKGALRAGCSRFCTGSQLIMEMKQYCENHGAVPMRCCGYIFLVKLIDQPDTESILYREQSEDHSYKPPRGKDK